MMAAYEIKVFPDGDMYCALIGRDLQDGIAGFGTTHVDAIRELCSELDKANTTDGTEWISPHLKDYTRVS